MAFIKNTEREHLIKNVNRSYAIKKFLLLIDIVALVAFVIMIFVSAYFAQKNPDWDWFTWKGGLTPLGVGMLIFAIIIVALGVVCVVLVFTIRSPKAIKSDIKKLESSALSGVKLDRKNQTAGDIMKQRRTPEKATKGKRR